MAILRRSVARPITIKSIRFQNSSRRMMMTFDFCVVALRNRTPHLNTLLHFAFFTCSEKPIAGSTLAQPDTGSIFGFSRSWIILSAYLFHFQFLPADVAGSISSGPCFSPPVIRGRRNKLVLLACSLSLPPSLPPASIRRLRVSN